MAKKLDPSPKVPQGEYPQLSPNPTYEDGLVDDTGIKPNGSESYNPQEKPTVFNGRVCINGKLLINGKEPLTEENELPPTTDATAGQVLKLDSNKKPKWQNDAAGMTNPMTAADDLIIGGTDGVPTRLPKGTEGQILKVGSSGLEWGAAGVELYAHSCRLVVKSGYESAEIPLSFVSTSSTHITPSTATLYHVAGVQGRRLTPYMDSPGGTEVNYIVSRVNNAGSDPALTGVTITNLATNTAEVISVANLIITYNTEPYQL